MAANAKEALLQVAVAREFGRVDLAIDTAVDHDGDAIRDRGRDADVLFDDQNVNVAILAEPGQHILDLCDDDGGQALGRLVHDQQARIEQKGTRDREHLLLAARQLTAAVTLAFRQPGKGRVDPLDRPGAALFRHQSQMLVDRERPPQPTTLRNIADAEQGHIGRRKPAKLLAGEADGASGGRNESHDRLAKRGLAHAVAPDHRKDAAVQREIDALHSMRCAVMNMQVADLENRRPHTDFGGGRRSGCDARAAAVRHDHPQDRAPVPRDRLRSPRAALP